MNMPPFRRTPWLGPSLLPVPPWCVAAQPRFRPPILNSIRAIPERDHLDDPTASPSSLTAPPRLSLASPQTNYKFQYDDTFVYENPLCSYLTADELVVKTTSGSLFVTTHIDHKKVYREPAANEAACPTDSNQVVATDSNSDTVTSNHNVLSTSSDGFSFANGICKYTQNTNLFPLRQAVNMELLHEFTTLSDIYGDVNPKTFIRRKGDDTDRKVIAAGEAIKLSVGDLLEIAGVDLDKPFDEQPSGWNPPTGLQGRGTSAGAYPYPRLTGTRLSINIQYYNYNLDDTFRLRRDGHARGVRHRRGGGEGDVDLARPGRQVPSPLLELELPRQPHHRPARGWFRRHVRLRSQHRCLRHR